MGDDQPSAEMAVKFHGRREHSNDLASPLEAEVQHTGENHQLANPDYHSDGEAQKYGRITAEDDLSIARFSTAREPDRVSRDGGAFSSTQSAPAQHKLQRLTEVGSDIAAARTAARGTQQESHPRPAAPAAMLLLTAREMVATTGAIMHGPAAAMEAAAASAEATGS